MGSSTLPSTTIATTPSTPTPTTGPRTTPEPESSRWPVTQSPDPAWSPGSPRPEQSSSVWLRWRCSASQLGPGPLLPLLYFTSQVRASRHPGHQSALSCPALRVHICLVLLRYKIK
jgi:hypothetical protein